MVDILVKEKYFSELLNLYKTKKFETFESLFKKCDQNNLICEKSYNLYGMYLVKLQKYQESINYFSKSINIKPNYYDANLNLCGVYINYLNRLEDAETILKKILDQEYDNFNANLQLAEIFFKRNKFSECENIYKKLLNIYPINDELYNKIGFFYYNINKYNEAITNFQKAIQLNPNKFNFYLNLLTVFKKENKIKDGIILFKDALKKFPENIGIHQELANLLRGIGDFQSSNQILKSLLIKTNFEEIDSIYQLISSPNYTEQKELVSMVKNKFHNYDDLAKEKLGYGLFKYFDRMKDFKIASDYLKESASLTDKRLNFNMNVELEQFHFLKDTFNKNFFDKNSITSGLNKTCKHIFIVGLPRSGSTLIQQMLSCNKDFVSYGETTLFIDLINKYYPNQKLDFFKSEIYKSDNNFFKKIGDEYKNNLNKNKISIDKQLSNYRMIGLIAATLNDSLIIHAERNKNDNLFSAYSNYYEDDHAPWSYNEENLKIYYNEYKNLMNHWCLLLENKLITIKYEHLVTNPKKEFSKILYKLNLDWDDLYLNYRKNTSFVNTQSVYQVREKIYDTSVDRWKNYKNYFPNLFKN